jgi:hypothetical protein
MSLWPNVRRWHGSPGPAQEGAGQTGLCSQSGRNTRQAADLSLPMPYHIYRETTAYVFIHEVSVDILYTYLHLYTR